MGKNRTAKDRKDRGIAAIARAIEESVNAKLGAPRTVSVTMVSQVSCDPNCPFRRSGCYAESGRQGMLTAMLNTVATTPLAVAEAEAQAIGHLSGTRPLRLHVVGDCADDATAAIVSGAADAYRARHGRDVWTYTHGWRQTARASWGGVSVLASCETMADLDAAEAKGYGTAMVRPDMPETAWREGSRRMIPCPQQTGRAAGCTDCRLCWNADALRSRRATIVFAPHGSGAKKVRNALTEKGV